MRRLLYLLAFVWTLGAEADVVQPTQPIYEGNRIVGFQTEDPNLFYIVPTAFRLYDRKIFLERNPATNGYALSFVIGPDYTGARRQMAQILNQNPNAILLPIPQTISEGFLDVPATVGTVSQRLVPDNIQYFQSLLYYRLELTPVQLDLLKVLTKSKNFLLGRLTYSFPYQSGTFTNVNEIYLDLRESDLVEKPRGPEYPYLWIKRMLDNSLLSMAGVLDGSYSLGGLVNISIANSLWEATVDTSASVFSADKERVYLRPTDLPNLNSHLIFRINELGSEVDLSIRARLAMSLDSQEISLRIESLELTEVKLANGTVSSFYQRYLNTLVNRPDVRARMAEELTRELQERILNQKLFLN